MRIFKDKIEAREIERHQAMLDRVVEAQHGYPERRFAGRGIVVCAGGDVYFTCAWICIGMLRHLSCTLPIELWYRGPSEMSPHMIELMRALDVECVDAYAQARIDSVRRLDSWELKPFAIAYSRFEEVLSLDADNVPVQDPSFLFDAPEYRATGALFWPDRYTGPRSGQEWLKRSAWKICRVPYRREPEIEAGQLLIDKRKSWRPLKIALHMNEHSDFYYAHFYGDKDTFRLAWHRAGCDYTLLPHPLKNLGSSDVIVQHDFDGRALFQHRNGEKWSLASEPKPIAGFQFESTCRELLSGLKALWRPPVRDLPSDFTRVEQDAYAAICATRLFGYEREGRSNRLVELRPDFSIGLGAGEMEVAWMIEEDKDGEPLLSIRNANAATCFLRRAEAGSWSGRWRVYDRTRVRLRPHKAEPV